MTFTVVAPQDDEPAKKDLPKWERKQKWEQRLTHCADIIRKAEYGMMVLSAILCLTELFVQEMPIWFALLFAGYSIVGLFVIKKLPKVTVAPGSIKGGICSLLWMILLALCACLCILMGFSMFESPGFMAVGLFLIGSAMELFLLDGIKKLWAVLCFHAGNVKFCQHCDKGRLKR